MRIGDVGAVSPAGDLLAFSLAVILVAALVVKVGSTGDEDRAVFDGPTEAEVRAFHLFTGFDMNDDGVLEFQTGSNGPFTDRVPVEGTVVARMECQGSSIDHLFIEGEYAGVVPGATPVSRVVGITSLFEYQGGVHCGTFSCFHAEVGS